MFRAKAADGWVILDRTTGRPYVWAAWRTKAQAEREREDLLRPYAQQHPWRKRLTVSWRDNLRKEE